MMQNKYRAKSVTVLGKYFPSKLEASVYQLLLLREKMGDITSIQCQKKFLLTKATISWKVDFYFYDRIARKYVAAEAKGIETSDYRIKVKLWKYYGPCPLEIWKGTYQKPVLREVIIP